MQKQRVIVVVASVLGVFSALLPWMNAPIVGAMPGTSMPHGGGWIALGVCCVALLGALGRGAMPVWSRLTSSCAGLTALGIAAWQIVVVLHAKAEMRADGHPISEAMAAAVSIGAGLYLLAASAVAILAAAIVGHRIRNMAPELTRESSVRGQLSSSATAEGEGRRQVPDLRKEPPWVIGPNISRATVSESSLSEHDIGTNLRDHGEAATKPTRSFFFWLLIGILGGAGVVYKVLDPPGNSIVPEAEHASTAAPARKPCADIGHFTACVTRVVVRTSVSNGFDGVAAQGDTGFVLVRVRVSNNGNSTDRIGWSSFLLHSGSRRWEPDTHVTMKLFGTGYDPLSLLEEVQPGTSVAGWLAFFAPRDVVADAYLAFTPGLVRTAELALPGLGSTPAMCSVDGQDGQCVDVATCAGRHVAGLCEGLATVQCCLP